MIEVYLQSYLLFSNMIWTKKILFQTPQVFGFSLFPLQMHIQQGKDNTSGIRRLSACLDTQQTLEAERTIP